MAPESCFLIFKNYSATPYPFCRHKFDEETGRIVQVSKNSVWVIDKTLLPASSVEWIRNFLEIYNLLNQRMKGT